MRSRRCHDDNFDLSFIDVRLEVIAKLLHPSKFRKVSSSKWLIITNFSASVLIRGEFEGLPKLSRLLLGPAYDCYNYFAANSPSKILCNINAI